MFAVFCLFNLFDIFIGFRIGAAITSIGIFTLWLSRRGRTRILPGCWKQIVLGAIFVAVLFLYKQLIFAVKIGDIDLLKSILSDSNTYILMITNSEPFVTQNILNEITTQSYHVGMEHLSTLVYQFILFSPELGLNVISFDDLYQSALFPEVDYGMANNIWAEMWSSGGWLLLLFAIFVFIIVLKLFSRLMTSRNTTLRSLIAVMASYWAFYIHRNDVNYQIVLEKRVLLVMVAAIALAYLIRQVALTLKPGLRREEITQREQ